MIIEKSFTETLKESIKSGGVIAFPTETVFGFGVIYDNKEAYDRLIAIKRRPPEKPFTLMLGDAKDIEKYAFVNEKARTIINQFLPGELTIILKAKDNLPPWAKSKEGTVGIRVPNNEELRKFILNVGKPLLVPSANRSGEPPINNPQEIISNFGNEIDAVVLGEAKSKVPSTIVMVGDDVKIIREGRIAKEDILASIKEI